MSTHMSLIEFVKTRANTYIGGDVLYSELDGECWLGRINGSISLKDKTLDIKTKWVAYSPTRGQNVNADDWELESGYAFTFKKVNKDAPVHLFEDGVANFQVGGRRITLIPKPTHRHGPPVLDEKKVKGL